MSVQGWGSGLVLPLPASGVRVGSGFLKKAAEVRLESDSGFWTGVAVVGGRRASLGTHRSDNFNEFVILPMAQPKYDVTFSNLRLTGGAAWGPGRG